MGGASATATRTNRYLVHLMACALSGARPRELPATCIWEAVFEAACANSIPGLVWAAARQLDSIPDALRERWQRSATMTLVRAVALDAEREVILSRLRQVGISYLVLKGAAIAGRYPDPTMRSMADNDILYGVVEPAPAGGFRIAGETAAEQQAARDTAAATVTALMRELSYVIVEQGEHACDIHFAKPPVMSFELHHGLMEDTSPLYTYYANPWRLARPCDEADEAVGEGAVPRGRAFAFSDEDLYVYLVAHAYKHARRNGTGIRIIADLAVVRHTAEHFDRAYVERACEELGIASFERTIRDLARAVFTRAELTDEQMALVDRMVASGTYGSGEEAMRSRLAQAHEQDAHDAHGRRGALAWFFSPDAFCPPELAVFKRHVILRPLYPFGRCILFLGNIAIRPREQVQKLMVLVRGK